jgi:hypothetical protein
MDLYGMLSALSEYRTRMNLAESTDDEPIWDVLVGDLPGVPMTNDQTEMLGEVAELAREILAGRKEAA